MKRCLLILLFFIGTYSAKATHLMGGDITVQYDSSAGGYVITLTHYRDTLGVPLYTVNPIDIYLWDNVSSSYILDQTLSVPLNTALSTTLVPSFPYGVEVGVYTDTVTLAPGKYRIINETCCRNGAILNMVDPLAESMVLYTDLEVDPANNSSPGCLAMPIAYFPINQSAVYNPLPYDPDGDSLAWNLNTPISTAVSGTSLTPVAGFTAPSADPAGPFTMNPITGEITWTPDAVGNYVQSFQIDEYKNGVQVGTMIRDMQYVIVPSNGNVSPSFSNITGYHTNTSQQYYYMYYTPASPLTFEIRGTDPDPNTQLEMTAFSIAFQMADPSTFNTAVSGADIIGTFKWTPPVGYTNDVLVVFRLRDGQFSKDFTLLLRYSPTGITTVNNTVNNFNVYPNPAHKTLNLSLDLNKDIQQAGISVYSSIGQQVKTVYEGRLMKGNNHLSEDINLAPGIYYVVVRDNGAIVKTSSIVIQ